MVFGVSIRAARRSPGWGVWGEGTAVLWLSPPPQVQQSPANG